MTSLTNIDEFDRSDALQGSPEWVEIRVGKPSASRLKDWLAVSKRDGSPLKGRLDYEAELAFEIQFDTAFSRFVTSAMEEGQAMEGFLKLQYEKQFEVEIKHVGCYYNNFFVASPDGEIGDDGLIECKWVYDKTFSDVLVNGVPEDHMLQIQGQLWASGRKWCDYVVGNANVKKFKVIRVERDEKIISRIRDSLKDVELSTLGSVSSDDVFDFSDSELDTSSTQVISINTTTLKLDKEF